MYMYIIYVLCCVCKRDFWVNYANLYSIMLFYEAVFCLLQFYGVVHHIAD